MATKSNKPIKSGISPVPSLSRSNTMDKSASGVLNKKTDSGTIPRSVNGSGSPEEDVVAKMDKIASYLKSRKPDLNSSNSIGNTLTKSASFVKSASVSGFQRQNSFGGVRPAASTNKEIINDDKQDDNVNRQKSILEMLEETSKQNQQHITAIQTTSFTAKILDDEDKGTLDDTLGMGTRSKSNMKMRGVKNLKNEVAEFTRLLGEGDTDDLEQNDMQNTSNSAAKDVLNSGVYKIEEQDEEDLDFIRRIQAFGETYHHGKPNRWKLFTKTLVYALRRSRQLIRSPEKSFVIDASILEDERQKAIIKATYVRICQQLRVSGINLLRGVSQGVLLGSSNLASLETILAKPPYARTPEDCLQIEMLFKTFPSYAKMDPSARSSICKQVTLETFAANSTLTKQGHNPTTVYFLLVGQCEAVVTPENTKSKQSAKRQPNSVAPIHEISNTVCIYGPGDVMGDYEVYKSIKRCVSIISTTFVTVLRLDADKFIMNQSVIESRYGFLRKMPFFVLSDPTPVHDIGLFYLSDYLQLDRASPAHPTIFHEGSICEDVFIIKSGTCRAMKTVPIDEAALNTSLNKSANTSSGNHELWEMTRLSPKNLVIGFNLSKEHNLIGNVDVETKSQLDYFTKSLKVFSKGKFFYYFSLVSCPDTEVEYFKIPIMAFAKIMTPQLLVQALSGYSCLYVPVKELQKIMNEQNVWEVYKTRVKKGRDSIY